MKGNRFKILLYWKSRKLTPEDIADLMLRSLDALSAICPFCENWWVVERGVPLEEIRTFPLEDVRSIMTKIVEQGVSRDDFGEPEPFGGYSVSAINNRGDGPASPRSVGFNVRGGGGMKTPRSGTAMLDTGYQQIPDPSIITYSNFKAILLALSAIFTPDYAFVTPVNLPSLLNPRPFFGLTWMTYLSVPLASRIELPTSIKVETDPDGGVLMIAAEETFDIANAEHMAGARAIAQAVKPLNPPPPPPWRPSAA